MLLFPLSRFSKSLQPNQRNQSSLTITCNNSSYFVDSINIMLFNLVVLLVFIAVALGKVNPTLKRIPRDTFLKLNRANPEETHELVFAIKQNNLDHLEQTLLQRSTPGSELYQKWLTYEEIGNIINNEESAQAVKDWLIQHGANIIWTTNHKEYIKAEAKISLWENLFNTQFHEFKDTSKLSHRHKNSDRYLRADHYTLPTLMSSHLSSVFHTIQTPPEMRKRYHTITDEETENQTENETTEFRTDFTTTRLRHNNDNNNDKHKQKVLGQGKVTISFLNEFYQIASNTGNKTQIQSVFETAEEHYSPNDLTQFQSIYNLPQQTAEAPYGYTTTDCINNDCYEGNLDIQYIMGIAQQTTSVYWYQAQTQVSDPFVDWAIDVANSTNPPLVNSISWGSVEQVCIWVYMYFYVGFYFIFGEIIVFYYIFYSYIIYIHTTHTHSIYIYF